MFLYYIVWLLIIWNFLYVLYEIEYVIMILIYVVWYVYYCKLIFINVIVVGNIMSLILWEFK